MSDGLVDIVDDGYDLAIRISSQPSDKFTIWRKIRKVPRILVAHPGSRFADMQHPNYLKPDDFLANSGEVLAGMAADGAGVALLPGFNIADHSRGGRLIHVFDGWTPPDLWLTLFYSAYQALPIRVASFSKFFEEQVAVHMVMLD